ncbi:hypothetical protein UFOVP1483_48 [uncultured Caudovirales phage]|uniref:Uncharacterized protein n=1 Tax=uncultured Caudovirales phage TaxID=2100421 RepID=A0A6J5SLW9_9CAUD|nr:hypothetical protein UFOVP1483_48 [uncultured Caudovirales phage]
MNILDNSIRVGRITSSQIYRLMGAPKPAKTYIQELKFERKLKRKLGMGKSTNATTWGLFMEYFVHQKIGLDYITDAQTTLPHPTISGWVGSPDTKDLSRSVVSDIKCFEPLNFCQYIEVLEQNNIELFKKEFPKEYWQLVSNSIILGMDNIEAIVYMPYEKDMEDIRNEAAAYDDHDAYKYRFIYELPLWGLPCLPDDSEYKDLNIFTFKVPQSDKDLLTEKVILALAEITLYNTDDFHKNN